MEESSGNVKSFCDTSQSIGSFIIDHENYCNQFSQANQCLKNSIEQSFCEVSFFKFEKNLINFFIFENSSFILVYERCGKVSVHLHEFTK